MKRDFEPIKPAKRTENIEYAVRDIVLVANEARKKGKELIFLNIGDPAQFDFRTPEPIIEATYQAMCENLTGYSASEGVDEAICAIRKEARKAGIEPSDIYVTSGASEAIDFALTALVNEGENVLVPYPGYPLYTAILAKLGAEPNPYYLDEENEWQPDLADIEAKINEKTRAIVIINPNNPTGAVYSEETLRGIIDIARRHQLVIFSDEIYDKLVFDGAKHISIASLDLEVPVVTFNGLSKSYLAPGFRIGWGIVSGPWEVVKDFVEAIHKLARARLSASHPKQYAIPVALNGNQGHLKEVIEKLEKRRDLTYEMLNDIPGISCVKPKGAFYAFPRIDIPEVSDREFVKELIAETGVVVVHGSGFGEKPGTAHFRVVFLPPEDLLKKAYTRIKDFMKKFLARRGLRA
ncbi:tyrosine/nicotianamine aminotransferase [Thermodesulfatator indicus DSM 15286]|uniref:Aminotransferase n=1 Tax=Thermodesulfatator indicus (strain DSM 15286 / JCM 11887 / CIR29812) TaxID=667014 RepID=F8A8C4_THEID|nr:aminotransferase class I/II-fold pyridoxal phosphate-dependent enzyme [Thermodesulfatator indicus]AEH43928.1 tyrosine/nicotianamine aminotransferase [Thermodesulfatator indicus DSM 15286]